MGKLSWSERGKTSSGLPNLGLGGTLVAVFISSYFSAHTGDALFVMLMYGRRAFFDEGLRVKDWKHGILSNGEKLSGSSDALRMGIIIVLMIALVACAELLAGHLSSLRERCAPKAFAVLRIFGGVMLVLFSRQLYSAGFALMHPIPFASFIAGVVLFWRGTAGLLRRN